MSNAVQAQAQKEVVLRQTETQAATQTVAVIQIKTIDWMMFSSQWLIIMTLNVLFKDQTQREMQTTMAFEISTTDQITPPY